MLPCAHLGSGGTLSSVTLVSLEEEGNLDTRERRYQCRDEGRAWSDASVSTPSNAKDCQKLPEDTKGK